jgi:hypothetical protein
LPSSGFGALGGNNLTISAFPRFVSAMKHQTLCLLSLLFAAAPASAMTTVFANFETEALVIGDRNGAPADVFNFYFGTFAEDPAFIENPSVGDVFDLFESFLLVSEPILELDPIDYPGLDLGGTGNPYGLFQGATTNTPYLEPIGRASRDPVYLWITTGNPISDGGEHLLFEILDTTYYTDVREDLLVGLTEANFQSPDDIRLVFGSLGVTSVELHGRPDLPDFPLLLPANVGERNVALSLQVVPEPSTVALLLIGLGALGMVLLRRR